MWRVVFTKQAQKDATPEVSNDLESQINAICGGVRLLAESERAHFEPRFGRDFSQVRVHTDARAAESAQAVNAQAFTVGRDVVFGAGQYAPESSTGQRLMAHELTHVVQQDPGIKNNTGIRESCNDHLSRQEAKEKPKKDEDEKTKVITDGAGLIWDNLRSQNPAFKKLVLPYFERS